MVTAIIGILGVVGINYYINSQKRAKFDASFGAVLSFVTQPRNYAITSKARVTEAGESESPPGGYGVHVDTNADPVRLILFSDIWNESSGVAVNLSGNPPVYPDHLFAQAEDEQLDFLKLDPFMQLKEIRDENDNVLDKPINIIFTIPFADTFLTDDLGTEYNSFKMTLGSTVLPVERTIIINKVSGFFTVEQF